MKYSIPHEPVEQIRRSIPRERYDARHSVFLNIKGLEKKSRRLSVGAYLGLAPFLYFSGVSRQKNAVLKHHTEYSLGFAFTTLCAVIYYIMFTSINYWVFTHFWRPTLEELNASVRMYGIYVITDMLVSTTVMVVWGLALGISVVGAIRGRVPRISIIEWLISRPWTLRVGAFWFLLIEIMVLIVVSMGVRSIQIAQKEQSSNAKVYILYTIGGYIPLPELNASFTPTRWMTTLAFYPTVKAGMERFGEDGVAVLPLTEENFAQATRAGKFIFVASHGGNVSGSFTLSIRPHIQYSPADVKPENVGDDLQFVYFAGCYTGDLMTEWKQVLRVDNAILFDRLSFVDEHMLWAWFKSPGVIKNLQ